MYIAKRVPLKHCTKNLWLVKPSSMNQGKGIEIFSTLKDIQLCLCSKMHNTEWIVQK